VIAEQKGRSSVQKPSSAFVLHDARSHAPNPMQFFAILSVPFERRACRRDFKNQTAKTENRKQRTPRSAGTLSGSQNPMLPGQQNQKRKTRKAKAKVESLIHP
jgi:hypothetical protein